MNMTVQHQHIFGRSAHLTYSEHAAAVRFSESAALQNGWRPGGENDFQLVPPVRGYK